MLTNSRISALVFISIVVLTLSSSVLSLGLASHSHHHKDVTKIFHTFDFDQNLGLDQNEFTTFFLSLFANDEKRFVSPSTISKLFHYLDMDNDGQLSLEEFRKIFHHWVLPIISPKTCLFLCLPRGSVNERDSELRITHLVEKSKALFTVHYVYLSSCHVDPQIEKINKLVSHVQQMLPKAYDITVYSEDGHRDLLSRKDFDQFVIDQANVEHDRGALNALMSLNHEKQHPTVFVTDQSNFDYLRHRLGDEYSHASILVSPDMRANPQERARYKTQLALVLARKIYRKYKHYSLL